VFVAQRIEIDWNVKEAFSVQFENAKNAKWLIFLNM
jgi:hypothetical protein